MLASSGHPMAGVCRPIASAMPSTRCRKELESLPNPERPGWPEWPADVSRAILDASAGRQEGRAPVTRLAREAAQAAFPACPCTALAGPRTPRWTRCALPSRCRSSRAWQVLDAHLAANGPFLLGKTLSVADFYLVMLMRWSRAMPKPATAWPHLAAVATQLKARPSFATLYQREGLTEWA
ncbi:hypothetical protein D7X12_02875 [Corallococcus sicarius]|uniref:GST C-terminal domain-containing protein n=1 Tax=Corallococcus sicarius TaxID=2316726 RepID=A0A3A8NTP6_9BACT|nr:hypothetical protein D7X12_02875 [Corallococcus sicarius]